MTDEQAHALAVDELARSVMMAGFQHAEAVAGRFSKKELAMAYVTLATTLFLESLGGAGTAAMLRSLAARLERRAPEPSGVN